MLRCASLAVAKRYNHKVASALEERLASLAESTLDSAGYTSIKNNPELAKILDNYGDGSQHTFESKYEAELAHMKLEGLLATNRHAREIADTFKTPAWNGTESVADSHLRMLVDTAPRAMGPSRQRKLFTPLPAVRDRIHSAKEGSLDYKLAKISEQDVAKKEAEDFRQLYRERLLGPLMFTSQHPSSVLGLAETMADVRINQEIDKATGRFGDEAMQNVRGKPLSREHLANCTNTNYFMNQILLKQECLPPWIESQKGVNGDIERLRFDLDKTWFLQVVDLLAKKHPGVGGAALEELVRSRYQGAQSPQLKLFDLEWHALKLRYLKESVRAINMKITTYNLSAPSANLHKWKLVPERELQSLYERVMLNLDKMIHEASRLKQEESQARPKLVNRTPEKIGFFKAVKSLVDSF